MKSSLGDCNHRVTTNPMMTMTYLHSPYLLNRLSLLKVHLHYSNFKDLRSFIGFYRTFNHVLQYSFYGSLAVACLSPFRLLKIIESFQKNTYMDLKLNDFFYNIFPRSLYTVIYFAQIVFYLWAEGK